MLTFSSKQFTHDKAHKVFATEASDIGFGGTHNLTRLYPDACDVGLALVSSKTGNIAKFYFCGVERDNEGDLKYWEFAPTTEALRQMPELNDYLIRIFND